MAEAQHFDVDPEKTRVYCPECGTKMQLRRVDPAIDMERSADTTTFRCECGFSHRYTINR